MKNKKAFTLIELLVVVLIIGILAAVAVPQYQKAVWKSRNTQLKQLVQAVVQAEKIYYLANGTYAANFDELSLDLPLSPVKTGPNASVGVCGATTQGSDSVRSGKDFYIVLNSSAEDLSKTNIVAYYTTGKYQCAGFGVGLSVPNSPEQLHCRERKGNTLYTAKEGEFCTQLEKGTPSSIYNQFWRTYQLP